MRSAILVVVFFLGSCSTLERVGHAVCSAQEQVSSAITDGLSWLGLPGTTVSRIVNMGLEVGCGVFDAVVSAPKDVATDVGLMEGEDARPEPAAAPDDQ